MEIFMKWILILFILVSCKTQEQIRREQLVDSLASQMRQGQNVSANFTVEMAEVKKQILQLQGMIEESGQQSQVSQETRITDLQSRVQVLEEKSNTLVTKLDEQAKAIEAMKTQLTDQGKYLQTLLKTLKNINKAPKKKAVKKQSPYQIAMESYVKGRYKSARTQLAKLAGSKSYKGKARARILHNLAMSEYMLKSDENALVYFSKLYSEQPTSAYNANGLLFMAKSFQRLKRNDEAKATLQELISKFPKSKKVAEAKKLLKVL
jgi:TolA-binding protein